MIQLCHFCKLPKYHPFPSARSLRFAPFARFGTSPDQGRLIFCQLILSIQISMSFGTMFLQAVNQINGLPIETGQHTTITTKISLKSLKLSVKGAAEQSKAEGSYYAGHDNVTLTSQFVSQEDFLSPDCFQRGTIIMIYHIKNFHKELIYCYTGRKSIFKRRSSHVFYPG